MNNVNTLSTLMSKYFYQQYQLFLYNKENNITPKGIEKAIDEGIQAMRAAEEIVAEAAGETIQEHDYNSVISELEYQMEMAARNLHFEKAAELRDKIAELKKKMKVA